MNPGSRDGTSAPPPQNADSGSARGEVFVAPVVGTWGIGGECIAPTESCLRVALFGAVPGRKTAPSAQATVERALGSILRAPAIDPATVLRAAAGEVGISLRRDFSPTQPEGTGVLALASVDGDGIVVAWTATGAAYLVRRGQAPIALEGDAGTQREVDDHLGGRARIDSEAALFVGRPDWQLLPDDRIVLSTRQLSAWFDDDALAELALQDSAEGAAQALSAMAGVRSGGDEVAVAVIEMSSGETQAELDEGSTDYGDLLDSLATVIPDLIAANERAREHEHVAPTEGFAPVREATPLPEAGTLDLFPETPMPAPPKVAPSPAVVSGVERDDAPSLVPAPETSRAPDPRAPAQAPVNAVAAPGIPAWVVGAAVLVMICGVIVGLFAL